MVIWMKLLSQTQKEGKTKLSCLCLIREILHDFKETWVKPALNRYSYIGRKNLLKSLIGLSNKLVRFTMDCQSSEEGCNWPTIDPCCLLWPMLPEVAHVAWCGPSCLMWPMLPDVAHVACREWAHCCFVQDTCTRSFLTLFKPYCLYISRFTFWSLDIIAIGL